jgi:hypothetical protein
MRGREVQELLGSKPVRIAGVEAPWTIFDTMKVVDRETAGHYPKRPEWDGWYGGDGGTFLRMRYTAADLFRQQYIGTWAAPCRACAEKDAEIERLRRLVDDLNRRLFPLPRF